MTSFYDQLANKLGLNLPMLKANNTPLEHIALIHAALTNIETLKESSYFLDESNDEQLACLRKISCEIEDLEDRMQELFGFERNRCSHRHYVLIRGCTCPHSGQGNTKTPLHWGKKRPDHSQYNIHKAWISMM